MSSLAAELPTSSAIAGVAALAAVAALAVWLIPRRQRERWERGGVTGKDLAELENSARSTLVQLLGGVALILTFVATWLQISDTRDATERTLRLTAGQQETERFTRAVEQLGSREPEVRLGGIYGLQQAARDTPSRRETVAQLMLAYLKNSHRVREDDRRIRDLELRQRAFGAFPPCGVYSLTPAWPDTQAALSVLLSIPRSERPRLDLRFVDLVGVEMNKADFRRALFAGASLVGAKLSNADFGGAELTSKTDLRGACLRGARFDGAFVQPLRVTGADFSGADLAAPSDPLIRDHFRGGDGGLGAIIDACTRLPWRRQVPARCDGP